MTIRLLSTYDGFSPNSIITIDPALEAAFIAAGNATADLTGGVVAYRERQPVMIQPATKKRGSVNLIANRNAFVPLTEGSVLTITPAGGTTGAYQRYDASGAAVGALTTIGTPALTVGPFEGDFTVEVKCTTGSLTAKVADAALAAPVFSSGGSVLVRPDGTTYTLPVGIKKRVVGQNICNFIYLTPGTDFSATSRTQFTPRENITNPALVFQSGSATATVNGGEKQQVSPVIYSATLEYPLGQPPVRFSVKGRNEWVSLPGAATLITDDIGVAIKAGVAAAIRVFERVPKAPTAQAIAAVSAGGLTASTTYYYVQTTMDNGLESGPSAEYSGTTGASSTLALKHTWAAPTYGETVRIYRSAAAGGTKQLLAEVSAKLTSYIDYGFDAVNTAVNPPAAQGSMKAGLSAVLSGNSTNVQSGSGNGTDQTATAGALSVPGPQWVYAPQCDAIVASGTIVPTFGGEHDSLGAGVGIQTYGGIIGPLSAQYGNWFVSALVARNIGFYNYSIPSAQVGWYNDGTHVVRSRSEMRKFADIVVSNMGTNDIGSGRTWQQTAADKLLWGAAVTAEGARAVATTVAPRSTSTDCYTTATNQTVWFYDAQRQLYNSWVRGGCQVDPTGAPVQSGGVKSPFIWDYFDLAAVFEVDSNNTPTLGGSRTIAPAAARYSDLVLSGTPTTTALAFTTSPFTVPSNSDRGVLIHAVKVKTGAAAGQCAIVSSGTLNTVNSLTLYANGNAALTGVAVQGLTTAPAAGDLVDVYEVYVSEGTHWTYAGHQLASVALQAWLSARGM